MSVPKFDSLFNPTLQALRNLGAPLRLQSSPTKLRDFSDLPTTISPRLPVTKLNLALSIGSLGRVLTLSCSAFSRTPSAGSGR